MWDAGSRQRRHRTLHSVHLRRQRGELTGYSSQIRLLSCGALRERHQHGSVLLLRQLNILKCRADRGIRYRDRSRFTCRLCGEAIEIRQRETVEIRQGKAIEIRQREAIEIRQGEAIEIRQGIGGGRANDGQGGQGHQYRRDPVRSPLKCRLRLLICLRFFVRGFSHLRSLRVSPVARFFLAADQQNKKAVAWTIQRRLSRGCPPKSGSNHELI
jgi:hypothetical protein